jgi:hypothetical protein
MNKLEKQIFNELMLYEGIDEEDSITGLECKGHAEIAAKIALELAERAYEQGKWIDGMEGKFEDFINQELNG